MSLASVSPTNSVAPAPTPSASSARWKIAGSGLRAPDLRREERRRRGARRCRARRDRGASSSGGSKAFETSPSFRPRSRSASSSAWRRRRELARGPPRRVLRFEEALELVVGRPRSRTRRGAAAPAPGTRSPRSIPGSKNVGRYAVAEALGQRRRRARGRARRSRRRARPRAGRAPAPSCMSVSPQSKRTASSTAGYATRALARRILWALARPRARDDPRRLRRRTPTRRCSSCSRALRSSRSPG